MAWIIRATLILALCVSMSVGVGMAIYRSIADEYRQHVGEIVQIQLKALKEDLSLEMGHLANSLSFLVDQVEMHNPFAGPEATRRLSGDLFSFVRTSIIYDQVRLLDTSGRELIRADYNNGKPFLVSEDALQDKSQRYYFKEGMKLKPGEVYASPFDLNIEYGKIEQPIKPTIRLAQAAFDRDGKRVGLVVVNVLGDVLLAHVKGLHTEMPVEHVYLLNQDGYWLAGASKENLWAFMYPGRRGRSMAKQDPAIWQQISSRDQTEFDTAKGLYLSDTFYPTSVLNRIGLKVERPGDRAWKLVAYSSHAYMDDRLANQYRTIMGSSVMVGVALAVVLIVLWRMQHQSALRQEAETQAREEKMQSERSRAIVTIAGGIAHEFNNILAGILGYTYLLRGGIDEKPELKERGDEKPELKERGDEKPELKEWVDEIDKLGQRAAELVQRLMTFAQVDISQSERMLLNELVTEKVEASRRALPENIRLELLVADNPMPLVADRQKLDDMLENLLNNAATALADTESPEIVVSLGMAEDASGSTAEHLACLTVADNGCGIAEEDLPHVFDPFYSTKVTEGKTGMGLALVYGVVHTLHGDIRIESAAGDGTTVRIRIPLAEQ